MSWLLPSRLPLQTRLLVDEVGIESARFGDFHLRTSYQPVFELKDHELRKAALQGSVTAFAAGRPVRNFTSPGHEAELDPFDIELLRLILQVRNYRNSAADRLELHLDLSPLLQLHQARSAGAVAALVQHMHDSELDPSLVVCALPSAGLIESGWREIREELRKHELGMAIDDFGASNWSEAQLAEIGPSIVSVEQDWLTNICSDAATIRLFETVVRRLQDLDARVLVGNIAGREMLSVASRAGVDLLQGDLLAPVSLVGMAVDDRPLLLQDLLAQGAAISSKSG